MFELVDSYSDSATIKVVGVGGGGGNAVAHMLQNAIEGVDFICANTDVQALKKTQATVQLQIGANITKGLGAGANPELGRQAAWKIVIVSRKCWRARICCSSPPAWAAARAPAPRR